MSKKKTIILLVVVSTVTGALGFIGGSFLLGSERASIEDRYSKIGVLEEYIDQYYLRDVSDETLEEGSMKGIFEALDDPYSVYMDADEFKQFEDMSSGKFTGVGIVISRGEDGFIEIVSPIKGTPGDKAGLKAGDKIVAVDGVEYSGNELDRAVMNIKGEKGTYVNLTIAREDSEGNLQKIEKEIIRDDIETESVESETIDNNIAYMKISGFRDETYDEFKEQLDSLIEGGSKGLIIDLRGNGGGSLRVVSEIAEELIDPATIVYTENKDKKREYIKAKKEGIDMPIAVLVDKSSASASEILAAAIKENDEGTIIGTTTYGKGLVQVVKELSDGSGFKLTISEYFSPDGNSIDQKGVEPNIEVELPEDASSIGPDSLDQDTQLVKAIETISEELD